MGWLDGFPFKSKEDREREERDFMKRVLPFGEAGKAKTLEVLQQVMEAKLDDTERLWAYFTAKDGYTKYEDDSEERALARAAEKIHSGRRLAKNDKCAVLALVKLDSEISSLEEYPTRDVVLTLADELAKSL